MGGALNQLKTNEMHKTKESAEEFRAKAFKLQEVMIKMSEAITEKAEAPVQHHFAPSIYAREMFIPQGCTIVGKIHKHSHINVISKGIIDVATEHGTIRYEAPITFVSEPLIKRVVHAVIDTIWTTIHATESTDLKEIERETIAESYDAIEDKT